MLSSYLFKWTLLWAKVDFDLGFDGRRIRFAVPCWFGWRLVIGEK